MSVNNSERIEKALEFANRHAEFSNLHVSWMIDQMVRALTGCPLDIEEGHNWAGEPGTYVSQGESPEYRQFVKSALKRAEQVTPEPYWDVGVKP